jgi:2-polyprenyl-3-methyl-5-hydroxy-6-metoxy-1,4-benzoquinol methylase
MKLNEKIPPREYRVGTDASITIRDCGEVHLEPDEQITFVTDLGGEYDVARKDWGFYATPSINNRLENFGLRTALVENTAGNLFVLLIEKGAEESFDTYLAQEGMTVISWLSTDNSAISPRSEETSCPICNGTTAENFFQFDMPPPKEIRLPDSTTPYYREVHRCLECGHFFGVHKIDLSTLYESDYVSATYGDQLRSTFDRIMALPPEKSDNVGRANRIQTFAKDFFKECLATGWQPKLLDVGSGLGVFPARMSAMGWQCTALDPDSRQVNHAREVIGIDAIHGDFMTVKNSATFDAITFNKVLEHVSEPTPMLRHAAKFLAKGGFVYVEVPDGEAAAKDGPIRGNEEFTVDHLHVFSATSLSLIATQAGFQVLSIERLQEPSGKYTLRVFLENGI